MTKIEAALIINLRLKHGNYTVEAKETLLRVLFVSACFLEGWKDKAMAREQGIKVIAQNKKARFEYFIEETFEAGIVLSGTEVKSVRLGKVNLKDSYATIDSGEIILHGMNISPYEQGNIFNKDPDRDRKLLMHKYEINKLLGYVTQKGMALVPLKVYFNKGKVKIELAVAKGKKLYDKRHDIAEKDAQREIDRRLKEN